MGKELKLAGETYDRPSAIDEFDPPLPVERCLIRGVPPNGGGPDHWSPPRNPSAANDVPLRLLPHSTPPPPESAPLYRCLYLYVSSRPPSPPSRVEARQIVAEAINARVRDRDAHSDVVLFTGGPPTGGPTPEPPK